ncbi:MAG TPA: hypothetical protein VFG32_07480 [Bacteroidota bacterium]|nr:hypothetical protein [Bacteroidota bacterium]
MMAIRKRNLLLLVPCAFLLGCAPTPEIMTWEPTGGPQAQELSSILVDEEQPSQLYAGLTSGAVYLSTNRGASWKAISVVRSATPIYRLVQHPADPNRLYAATGVGVFVSSDRGRAWNLMPVAGERACLSFTIEPFNTSTMYAGVSGLGVLKTTDAGATWRLSAAGLDSLLLHQTEVHDIKIDPTNPEHILAALSGIGVVASANGGATWTRLTEVIASVGVTPTQILIHPKTSGTMVLGMSGGTLYISRDGGATWSPTRFGTGGNSPVSLALHPGNNEVVYAATESEALFSSDFGTTWKTLSEKLPRLATSLAISPEKANATIYIYGQGLGLQRSADDGKSWVNADNGLGGSTVTCIVGARNNQNIYAAVGTGVYKLTAGASGWVPASNGLTGGAITSLAVDTDSMSFAYAATQNGLFKTTNNGGVWFSASQPMHGRPIAHLETHPIIGSRMFLSNGDGLFVSTDRGKTWKPTRPLDGRYAINTLTFSPTNAGLIFGATNNQAVIRTTDGGFKWESTRYGLAENDVRGVTIDMSNNQVAYTWTARGDGFRSTNGGIVWDRYTPPWNPGERSAIAIDKYRPSSAVAIVEQKRLYYTANAGATWTEIPFKPLDGDIETLYWSSRAGTLFVGMKNLGVYRLVIAPYLKQRFEE